MSFNNGISFSPFVNGPVNGNSVTITVPVDAVAQGHSHYNLNQYGTFSPQDLYSLYILGQGLDNPMEFISVIATPGGGVSMIKIIDHQQFNMFVSITMPNGDYTNLSTLYELPAYNVGSGADATVRLRTLLSDFDAGLKIIKIPNPNQDSNSNPCQ